MSQEKKATESGLRQKGRLSYEDKQKDGEPHKKQIYKW